MAVSKQDLLIKIEANTASAVTKITDLEKRITSLSQTGEKSAASFSAFTGTMGRLGAASIALNQGLDLTYKVFNDLIKPVATAVVAFQQHQDVLAKLSATLSFVGETNVPEAAKQFERLASSIEDMIGVDEKAVISLVSMAKASGLTNDQVKKLATTAANFSAGAGIGFEQAFMALQKTLKGSAIGIATFRPELKNLTDEQLRAGQAIDYIASQYDGFGKLMAGSFGVSLLRASDSIDDLQKSVGGLISDFIPVQRTVEAATATIRDLAKFISMIPNDLGALSTAYQVVKFFAEGIISSFDMVFETISRSLLLAAEVVMTGFNALAMGVLATVQNLSNSLAGISLVPESWVTSLKALTDRFATNTKSSFDRVVISARAVKDAITSVPTGMASAATVQVKPGKAGGVSVVDQNALKELDQLKAKTLEMQGAAEAFGKTQREQIAIRLKGELEVLEAQRQQLLLAGKKAQAAEVTKQMAAKKDLADKQTAAAPASAYEGMVNAGQEMARTISGQMSEGMAGSIAGAAAAANSVLDAVQGLIDLGPQVLNKIANIFSSLADLPDKLLEAVMNIDTALEKFIEKFPDALARLFSRLPEIATSILEKLGQLSPKLTEAIVRAIPPFVSEFIRVAPRMAVAFAKGFIEATRDLMKALFDGSIFKMPKVFDPQAAAQDIKKIARKLTEEASKVFAVLDFTEGGKRADTVVAKVEAAAKKTKDQLDQMWRNVEIGTQRFFDSAGRFLEGIGPAFATAWSGLEQAIGPFFEGIGNMVTSAFSTVGQTVWNGLQSAFSGLGNLITDIINNLNPELILKKVFALSGDWGGGRGDVEKLLGIDVPFVAFAEGGIVPGQSKVPGDSPLNDRILAMLSPGEAVIPRSVMAKPGMKDLVDQVLSGSLPALALSGGLKKVTSAVASAVANPFADVWEGLSQAAQDAASAVQSVLTVGLDAIQQAASLMGVPVEMLIGEVSKKASGGLKAMISSNASQAIGFASGGVVPGSGYGDSVPAMLTPGEFVINRRAVQSIGLPALEAINAGKSGGQGTVTVNQSFDVSIETSEKLDEAFIRTKLVPALKKELKRASLDGQFVIAASGVRS